MNTSTPSGGASAHPDLIAPSRSVEIPRRLKVRALIRLVSRLDWRRVRQTGSHETWSSPHGSMVTIVVNHPGHDASPVVLAAVRRALQRDADEVERRAAQ